MTTPAQPLTQPEPVRVNLESEKRNFSELWHECMRLVFTKSRLVNIDSELYELTRYDEPATGITLTLVPFTGPALVVTVRLVR